MGIAISIDEKLMEEARRLTGERDHQKVAEQVFREYIKQKSQIQGMLDLVGKVRLRDAYDHKSLRAGDGDSH